MRTRAGLKQWAKVLKQAEEAPRDTHHVLEKRDLTTRLLFCGFARSYAARLESETCPGDLFENSGQPEGKST